MEPREIVRRAIRFETPPRLPVLMDSLGVADVAGLPIRAAAGFRPSDGDDEWGCRWRRTDTPNMGQVKGHPLARLADLDRMAVPDYSDPSRYADCAAALGRAEADGKYVVCGIFMVLFERMHALHGFENVLIALYQDRPGIEALADRIVDVHVNLVREVARRFPGRVNGWTMSDDWGTQQAAFIGFDLWMEVFFPRYKRIFDAMHGAGCEVWVHSCGRVNEIIEGYIRAGVDVVNLQQPRALGIEEVGSRYRGRIAFQSLADIQTTLPSGDRARVEADVEALMTHWATPRGGFLFSDYGDDAAIGVLDPSMKVAMYESFSAWSRGVYGAPLPPLPNGTRDVP